MIAHAICLMASSVNRRPLPSCWRPEGGSANVFEHVHDELIGDTWLVGLVTEQELSTEPYPAPILGNLPREPWFV